MTAPTGHVLVERSFEVPCPANKAWDSLANIEDWPAWAPHIAQVQVSPARGVSAETSGVFQFRPVGRSSFTMTDFDPPHSWTWSGRALGVPIDYEHRFEPVSPGITRLVWVVRSPNRGIRARLFAVIYGRLIDRAWPRFVASVRDEGHLEAPA